MLQALLEPYSDDGLDAYSIFNRVDDPDNGSPDIIEPVDVGEQSELGEFGSRIRTSRWRDRANNCWENPSRFTLYISNRRSSPARIGS